MTLLFHRYIAARHCISISSCTRVGGGRVPLACLRLVASLGAADY